MSTVQSVERAFLVLRALSVSPAGVSEIAQQVHLPKSTVARLLATLEGLGVITRNGDSAMYRIGEGLAEISGSIDATAALSTMVRPHLTRLAATLGEAAGFSVPAGYTIEYLVQVEGPNPVQVRDYSGLSLPMHVGPSGLCVMAQWPAEEVARYLARPLEAFTAHTVVAPQAILERLDQVRRRGYAWVVEEFAEGITSVAAPVFDRDHRIIGAVHVHGPTYRFPEPGGEEEIGDVVAAAARRLSARDY